MTYGALPGRRRSPAAASVGEFLAQTGLFDADWYSRTRMDGQASPDDALQHYLEVGLATGCGPNQAIDQLGKLAGTEDQSAWLPGDSTVQAEAQLIEAIGLFDGAFYLASNPDVANAQLDPLRHFCKFGWKELRSPAPGFDTWWYWCHHMDPRSNAMNPLLHHALVGLHRQLPTRPAPTESRAGVALDRGARRICLFAGYDRDGLVDDYVVHYLAELSRHADVYYLADCDMAGEELAKLSSCTKGAWAIRHGAYDFGSYSMLARDLVGWDVVEGYDELILANDSCYLLRPLDRAFADMAGKVCDWWGMQLTKRDFVADLPASELPPVELVRAQYPGDLEREYINSLHVSSYFVAFRREVIRDPGFRGMLDSVVPQARKSEVIRKYEIGISRYLSARGYRVEALVDRLYPFHPLYTTRHFELIRDGFPLLKRLLLSDNPLNAPVADWKRLVGEGTPAADVEMLERNLLRVSDHDKLHRSFRIVEDESGKVVVPTTLSNEAFVKADHETPKFDHWWAFPACAFDDTFAGNERAVFEEVRDDPSIKKIVLSRRKEIRAEGENVVVVPLDSPEGQYYLLRAKQIFVKHSPSINAKWPLSAKLHNFINLWHGIPLKRFGHASLDMADKLEWVHAENRKCRAVITSSKMDTLAMAAAFYPLSYREMWATGLPRNDFILREEAELPADLREQGARLREQVAGRRLVLFLPTFKNSQEEGYYRFGEEELAFLRDWLARNNAVLGVREHMADKARTYSRMLSPLGILDLSSKRYPDIEMLYRAADLLVTDYSSCAIDFMLTGRPVISFAYDYEHYANTERGLFYDLEHVFPGPVCRDFGQLATALERALSGPTADPGRAWRMQFFFDHVDDGSAGRVVDRVKALYVDIGEAPNAKAEAA